MVQSVRVGSHVADPQLPIYLWIWLQIFAHLLKWGNTNLHQISSRGFAMCKPTINVKIR